MTEKTTIRIENILDKQTNAGKKYKVLRNNGDGFFVWDSKLMEGIAQGDTVEIEHEGGKYPKVVAVRKVEPQKQERSFDAPEPDEPKGRSESGTNARTALITSKELICNFMKDLKFDTLDSVSDEVMRQAEKFRKFLDEGG